MAVGDVVNGFSPISTQMDFQPAASVECIISSVNVYNTWAAITDGTNNSLMVNYGTTTGTAAGVRNAKICINNTYYLRLYSTTGHYSSYSGIQIK
mgnify:FL=1